MEAINSYDQVIDLEQRKQVVAVFVASLLDVQAISWIYDTWRDLNWRSGDRWHIVVPLINLPRNEHDFERLVPNNFNYELARQIQKIYGVADEDTPCLIFDDFNDEVQQMKVGLGDFEEAKRLILKIQRFMDEEVGSNERLSDHRRRELTAKLVAHLRNDEIKQALLGWAPKAGSALAKIASNKLVQEGAKWVLRAYGAPIPM
jgi:hypothetical protein